MRPTSQTPDFSGQFVILLLRVEMRKQNLVTLRFFIERPVTSDKSYPGDNRLVGPESSYRRSGSAPRCRLILARGWRRSQAFGCSPIKRIRELGLNRQLNLLLLTSLAASDGNVGVKKSTHIGEVLTTFEF